MSCLAVVNVNNSFTHIHNPLLLLIQIKGGMGRNMHASSGHIDHATIAEFRQGDFVDQTQHVKNAFCFCMLTLMACVNKTWQRSDISNSCMLCQKTSSSDEAIVCWYLHSYLDKWIQEFQEEEEYSAANGGQRHPKRNKGKGKHNSQVSIQYYMLSEKKIPVSYTHLTLPTILRV